MSKPYKNKAVDAHGVEICAQVECPVCGQRVASRPDGSPRNHSVMVNRWYPRLGVEACPGGKKAKHDVGT